VAIDGEFLAGKSPQRMQSDSGDVVARLIVPKPKSREKIAATFFKKSRRKSFDLAICNAACFANVSAESVIEVPGVDFS
jgi:CO/xanthine dehydrogenase FAD-binding subunit